MIQIAKGPAPPSLVKANNNLLPAILLQYNANPIGYGNGSVKFAFGKNYNASPVKNRLKSKQNNKCCFSEAKFNGDYGDVDHFRPKGRIDKSKTKKLYPGYYWLAYDWDNLLLCKQVINSTYKKNFFPLLNETLRKRNHSNINIESPIFINPFIENPRNHIIFYDDEPKGITKRGKLTVELLGLKHPDFAEARREKLKYIKSLVNLIEIIVDRGAPITDPRLDTARSLLRDSIKPEAEFSSMAIDFLSTKVHLL